MNTQFSTDFIRPASALNLQGLPLRCNTAEGQKELNAFYLRELSAPGDFARIPTAAEYRHIYQLEDEWNAFEESRIDVSDLPRNSRQFDEWYIALRSQNRKDVEPFFRFLAEEASLVQLSFYLALEAHVDGRFDDIMALSQIGTSADMKLALAENFWDEMGNGELEEMHTRMFARGAKFFAEQTQHLDIPALVPTGALKNGNILMFYALRRQYSARLLGVLTLLEQTVPYRFSRMVKGMERHGVPSEFRYYHEQHVAIDAGHGKDAVSRVLLPLTRDNPESIREVCIGCLIRYQIEFDYYRGVQEAIETVVH